MDGVLRGQGRRLKSADTLDDDVVRGHRVSLIDAPHVVALNAHVRSLRLGGRDVPWFDPFDGGVHARVLVLLETPARSGLDPRFVSRDNPSPAQRNLRGFLAAASLARNDTVLWNTVPWVGKCVGDDAAPTRALREADIQAGLALLPLLLARLPALRVVVLAGRVAGRAAPIVTRHRASIHVVSMPHPSPLAVCRHPHVAVQIEAALTCTANLLHETGSASPECHRGVL